MGSQGRNLKKSKEVKTNCKMLLFNQSYKLLIATDRTFAMPTLPIKIKVIAFLFNKVTKKANISKTSRSLVLDIEMVALQLIYLLLLE